MNTSEVEMIWNKHVWRISEHSWQGEEKRLW